jgi:serine/threonine protein kinase
MKVLHKEEMEKRKKQHRVQAELEVFKSTDHPFVLRMHDFASDDNTFCFITEYCAGGELYVHLQDTPNKCIPEAHAKFYIAEIIVGVEYLHSLNIIYRDLKPESNCVN